MVAQIYQKEINFLGYFRFLNVSEAGNKQLFEKFIISIFLFPHIWKMYLYYLNCRPARFVEAACISPKQFYYIALQIIDGR